MATEIIRKGAGAGASRLMNREEYYHIADSDDGYVSELVRGMVVRDPGIMWEHGHLQGKLFRYLDEWMERFWAGYGQRGLRVHPCRRPRHRSLSGCGGSSQAICARLAARCAGCGMVILFFQEPTR